MAPTLITLASFDSIDGANPVAGVIADEAGNLFGTTSRGGAYGLGAVFELARTSTGYEATPTAIASFPDTTSAYPSAELISDGAGHLYGVTTTAVFVVATTDPLYTPPQTIATFEGSGAFYADAGLSADGAGNLFGTTLYGGTNDLGTVFEINRTDTGYDPNPRVVASFGTADGASPSASLIADGEGNLFGTTESGGTAGDGTVFEIAKDGAAYDPTPRVIASFSGTDGKAPTGNLVADSAGNLFGTTLSGGASGDGTVFKIAKTETGYAAAPAVIATFTYGNGAYPAAGLIVDDVGNLFGTTEYGGVHGIGTVFEIVKTAEGYVGTPRVLASFDGTNGAYARSGLIADAAGNLFGTALQGGANDTGTVFEVTDSGYGTVACYCRGTLIATAAGEVPVETLSIGDCLVTARGALRPIRWTGHRTLDTTRHPDPESVWPVRIRAGAFAEGVPVRDLWMSPGHMVFVDGGLLAIRYLINGTTIVQERRDRVTYWHVELDSHDIILAEALPAESYLDTGNRTAFVNGGAYIDLHPTFETHDWTHACAPLIGAGRRVEAIRARLAARIPMAGFVATAAHDMHLVADGRRIDPIGLGDRRFAFALPAGVTTIDLISRTFVPRTLDSGSTDDRSLGVSVGRLKVNGTGIDLSAVASTAGWHKLEGKTGQVHCWTSGRTPLPAGSRFVVLDLALEGRYWIERRDDGVPAAA